ncbi:extracellular mutant protein 11-domain-containing protein [Podospora appendiculata]|uniref:Extracellular mutant protein 11-domain-containing protein n=1 Tax=Podospora appendiculata TaxID=314037 RepID=A0AAE1CBB9_9PEZI|nr:extracellular mutant protein 11-domain-containing protein [Podospora appendiculata]
MRLSMMPTAKKKLGGMGGLFTRQADGSVTGPGSPRAVVGLPATPAPVANSRNDANHAQHQHQQHQQQQQQQQHPQLQPPPEIISRQQHQQQQQQYQYQQQQQQQQQQRQQHQQQQNQQNQRQQDQSASPRSIPVPRTGRYTATSQPAPAMSLPAQHFHPMQRTRTSASDNAVRGQNAWEDSSVGSMFGDHESKAASESRFRGHQGNHVRQYSDAVYQRTHQSPAIVRTQPSQHDENLPFVIGENGLLKVITGPPATSSGAPALNSTMSGGLHQEMRLEDVYQDDRQLYENTPTKLNPLRRTKLPHRDARELKRDSFPDRAAAGYSSDAQSLGMSPERSSEHGEQIEKVRLEERMRRDREREQERELERQRERQLEHERELHHKRSTVFEDLVPIEPDDPTFNNTQAAVIIPISESSGEDIKEALQRTPRAARHAPPPQQSNPFGEGSLARAGSRRLKEPSKDLTKKRRLSLDYNDAELNRMSYSDLRTQSFDYDPQAAALQQTTVPSGGSLEERLEHYKGKGGMDQHQFFTRISANEWEESGDWFLEQFTSVVLKMKKARKEKRKVIEQFEGEIAAREEAVRGKIENIGRTLEDLKQEGQTMMAGKEMDLEF